jgi:hypothetical protein
MRHPRNEFRFRPRRDRLRDIEPETNKTNKDIPLAAIQAAARELVEIIKPDPPIVIDGRRRHLTEKVMTAASLLEFNDEITFETGQILKALGASHMAKVKPKGGE